MECGTASSCCICATWRRWIETPSRHKQGDGNQDAQALAPLRGYRLPALRPAAPPDTSHDFKHNGWHQHTQTDALLSMTLQRNTIASTCGEESYLVWHTPALCTVAARPALHHGGSRAHWLARVIKTDVSIFWTVCSNPVNSFMHKT